MMLYIVVTVEGTPKVSGPKLGSKEPWTAQVSITHHVRIDSQPLEAVNRTASCMKTSSGTALSIQLQDFILVQSHDIQPALASGELSDKPMAWKPGRVRMSRMAWGMTCTHEAQRAVLSSNVACNV